MSTVKTEPEVINIIKLEESERPCDNYFHRTAILILKQRFHTIGDIKECNEVYAKKCRKCGKGIWRVPEYTVSTRSTVFKKKNCFAVNTSTNNSGNNGEIKFG